jgi:hypothetical protein
MYYKSSFVAILFIFGLIWSCNETNPVADNEDKEAPTVSIYNPLTNSTWNDGAVIVIKAQAADNEKVVKVEFYVDGNKEFTDDSSDYYYAWNTAGRKGSHQIFAKAYDLSGNVGQSETIAVKIINENPFASFTVTPDNGDTATVFKADASAVTDREDSTAELEVRWDWESDGIWCTLKLEEPHFLYILL